MRGQGPAGRLWSPVLPGAVSCLQQPLLLQRLVFPHSAPDALGREALVGGAGTVGAAREPWARGVTFVAR